MCFMFVPRFGFQVKTHSPKLLTDSTRSTKAVQWYLWEFPRTACCIINGLEIPTPRIDAIPNMIGRTKVKAFHGRIKTDGVDLVESLVENLRLKSGCLRMGVRKS